MLHVPPTDSFTEPENEAFNHVALYVDEPRETVRERVEATDAEVVTVVDERLGATGAFPSIHFENPVGYLVELKSAAIEA